MGRYAIEEKLLAFCGEMGDQDVEVHVGRLHLLQEVPETVLQPILQEGFGGVEG
jgi:hypothetical protein